MSRRVRAVAGSALFLVVAPGTVAGVIPYIIRQNSNRLLTRAALFDVAALGVGRVALVVLGAVLIGFGSIGLLDSFRRFAVEGLGTPAPVYPTRHLVITGLYRYARNPMYIGVVSTILGQALLFGSGALLGYGLGMWALFHAFVLGYEEPKLRAMFGREYEAYRAAVPRWVPRLTAWGGYR